MRAFAYIEAAQNGSFGGLTCCLGPENHYEIGVEADDAGTRRVVVRKQIYDVSVTAFEAALPHDGPVEVWIEADEREYRFYYGTQENRTCAAHGSVAALCTEVTSRISFTGARVGLFCEHGSVTFSRFEVSY